MGKAFRFIPPRILLGKRFQNCFRLASDAQWWPAQRAREYQLAQLRRLCSLAMKRSSYYKQAFRAAGFEPGDLKSPEDLRGLPLIDKSVIIERGKELCTTRSLRFNADTIATGGTSGTPLRFHINKGRSSIEYAYLVASWARIGYELGMPMAVARGHVVGRNGKDFHYDYDPILQHHLYSSFHMSEANLTEYLAHMGTIGPCFLHAYPSTLTALARHSQRTGVGEALAVSGIIAESEILHPEQRQLAESAFNCRCLSCYGHSEKLILAAECEHSTNYHVWPTYGYFELIDKQGRAITTPGEQGEIVGTGFINTVMPFIRYRTGDRATYVSDRCDACGREHPIIADIRGHRIQEVLLARDGTEIPWTAMNMHDDTFIRVRQFQFHQDAPGKATLRIVPAEGFSPNDSARILKNLAKKLNDQVTLTIETTDAIPLSPRGKAIYVSRPDGQTKTMNSIAE